MMTELKCIMLVDDEPDIREVAKLALSKIGGFNLIVCHSGEEAFQSLQTSQPQLILLDVMMPEMDGPTTFKKLRDHQIRTPVIFMTAKIQKAEINDYLEMGAIGIIPKPFDPISLSSDILKIWLRVKG